MSSGKSLKFLFNKFIPAVILALVGLLAAVNAEAAATRYYVVANSGTDVGGGSPQDGTTNLSNGNSNDNGSDPYYFKALFSTTAPSGSSTQLRLDVGGNLSLVEIGRVFLSSDYTVATTIAANPTGKFALRAEHTDGEFTFVLEDYYPSFGNPALHSHTPFATATVGSPGDNTAATNVTFTSSSYTIPTGHRVLLRIYYTNNRSSSKLARVYCNRSSDDKTNSYINLSESAGAPAVTYTITPTAGTGGSISPSAAVTVTEHSTQAFTISHNANYILTDVLIDGVSTPSAVTSNAYTFSDVTANHSIQAVYSPTYTITPTAGANGTLSPGASVVLVSGGSQTFDITPNSGYMVQDVLVNGSSVGAVTSYAFTNVTSNKSISASFAVQTSLINNYNIIPPFVASGAPPNVMIMLSIETPMQGDAYPDLTCTGNPASSTYGCSNNATSSGGRSISSNYSNTKSYSGYFDSNKCYTYSGSAATGLFTPSSTTANHQCSAAWSGNFLNYATTMALDSFRIAFTGGNRDVDSTTSTVLLAGRQTLGAGNSWYSIKQLASSNLYTPYTGTIYIVRHEKGFSVCSATGCTVAASSGWPTTSGATSVTAAFSLRVKVCDTTAGLESFCNTNNNKPEGVLQKYADRVRFGLVSYAMTDNASTTRDGGVLRSNIKWLPTKVGYGMKYHDASGNVVSCATMSGCTNPEAEWDANGLFVSNPDAAASSLSVSGGLVNYINKFGYTNGYKSYDPISELYYQAVRYFANNPNNTPTSPKPPSNYSYCNGITTSDDGFIAYCNNTTATSWRDAFVFPCSQSSIIAISDANPWLDKRIPGTAFTSAYGGSYSDYCGTGTLACDTDMPGLTNTVTYNGNSITGLQYWTDRIGDNDGLTPGVMNVGCVFTGTACTSIDSGTAKTVNRLSQVVGTAPWAGKENSYYISGLAYYARMTNLRPDLAGAHNVTSYFIDTQEPNTSMLVGNRNMLYLAGKYGGFVDNDGDGAPFTDSTCGTSTPNIKCKEWDTTGTGFPDNYMFASDPTKVRTGLDQMLSGILKRLSSGTAASILNNSEGSGANLLQAVFYPFKSFEGTEAKWIGEMQNLWYYLDPNLEKTSIREDTNQDNVLNLKNDKVVQFYFDSVQNITRVNRYLDTNGDGAADSTTPVDTVLPDSVLSLWKAGRRLWERDLTTSGRTIYTSLNSTIGSTPQKFSKVAADGFLSITGVNTLLQAANSTEASTIIDYIHGTDQTGYRSRKVTISGCGLTSCNREWKLSDIVSSTPKLVSNVRLNSYNLPSPNGYNDKSYETFTNTSTYLNRGMVMVGANDGMLHAFKLGILKEIGSQFDKSKIINTDGTTANASSNLGVEQWAFIPKQALPYLKYLGDPQYNHLYYIDRTPMTVDANINRPSACDAGLVPDSSDCTKASTSWRTVLIGGMGIGGGSKATTDTCTSPANCVKTPISGTGYSSYFALDVTDPANPLYLWDFYGDPSLPGTLGYSTTGPAIVRVSAKTKDAGGNDTHTPDHRKNGKWFAVFASGPTGPIDTASHSFKGESDQQLRIFVVDLATGTLLRTIDKFSDGATSLPANAFAGSLASSVIDTDRSNPNSNGFYSDDAVYIGYVQKDTAANTWTKGGVLRLQTMESRNPADWNVSTVISGIGPVTTSVTKLQDRKNHNLWLYFGTGRFFYKQDDNSTTQQKLYGLKEPCYSTANRTMQSIVSGGSINDIDVNCTDSITGTLVNQTGDASTAPATSIAASAPGWAITLDPSNTISLTERVITDPIAATNGAVFFTTFKPSADICKFGGDSLVWALRYDTGGVPPSAAMQGRALMQVSTGAFAEISLSTAFINPTDPTEMQYNGRRLATAISGVPPTAQGLSLLTNPKPIKKLLQIQEK